MGLRLGHGGLLLGLSCDARYSRLSRGGSDAESSLLAASQLVQSGWDQPGLTGWGSVLHKTEIMGLIDLEMLIFPPAPPF